jgi:hypothetical protein
MPARAGGRGLKPKRARRGAVARGGRRAARVRRIDRLGVAAEVLENPSDDRGRLDAGESSDATDLDRNVHALCVDRRFGVLAPRLTHAPRKRIPSPFRGMRSIDLR